jgi:hypothetical protein
MAQIAERCPGPEAHAHELLKSQWQRRCVSDGLRRSRARASAARLTAIDQAADLRGAGACNASTCYRRARQLGSATP